ncbi:MAG: HisA/HisF-related TIM barrel protein [Alphaproteobacteria bacterium]|nr:HisA/HisF-related TIM barrel protein [Alphaproteobacteria bacterium]
MILYPSIHIKDGAVARLTRSSSDRQQAEILYPDPAARAAFFADEGFPWLHVVDLDAAFNDNSPNGPAIENILKSVKIPVQLSGGMRSMKAIEGWLEKGVARVVLASAALQQPDLMREACKKFPGKIAVKIDSIGGYVAQKGWANAASTKALDLALRVEDAGADRIIYADINLDGALSEVDLEAIIDLAFALTVPVIASGGVHSLQDLAELKAHADTGISGLILGRALYNGAIDAREALALAAD